MLRGLLVASLVVLAAGSAAADNTLDKIAAAGRIVLGVREDAAPFSFRDASGTPAGYSVDLCEAVVRSIAEELALTGLETVYETVSVEDRFARLAKGEIDLECGATTFTLSRQAEVDFSLLTFPASADLLVREADPVNDLSDLAGRRVAVRAETPAEGALQRLLEDSMVEAEIVTLPAYDEAIVGLERGDYAAVYGDQALLLSARMAATAPDKLVLLGATYTYAPYALAVRRDDSDFRQAVDRGLARLYRSDEILTIYETWFGHVAANPQAIALYDLLGLPD